MKIPLDLVHYVPNKFYLQGFISAMYNKFHTMTLYPDLTGIRLSEVNDKIISETTLLIKQCKIPFKVEKVVDMLYDTYTSDIYYMRVHKTICNKMIKSGQVARGLSEKIPEDCVGIVERFLVGNVRMGSDRYLKR